MSKFMLKAEPILFDRFGMVDKVGIGIDSPYMQNPQTKNKMDVDWFAQAFNQNEFKRMLSGDFLVVGGSVVFVARVPPLYV